MKKPDMYLDTGILISCIDYMSLEEKGQLLEALVLFHEEGLITEFDKKQLKNTYERLIERAKDHTDRYIQQCLKNQKNANKRWNNDQTENEEDTETNDNNVSADAVNALMDSVKTLWMRTGTSEDEKSIRVLLKKYSVPNIRAAMITAAKTKPDNPWGYVTGILQG